MSTNPDERRELANRLLAIQTYGQAQAERLGINHDDIPALVENAIRHPDPVVLAQAHAITASMKAPFIQRDDDNEQLSEEELLLRGMK